MRIGILLICVCPLIMLYGCGGDGGGGGPTKTAASLTTEGWVLFEQGQYEDAKDKFDEAIGLDANYFDAYNGLGWSNAKLDMFAAALTGFSNAISIDAEPADPYAGRAPVYRDHNKQYQNAITAALTALSKDREYEFSHDATFDWEDLMLILAQSYFGEQEYISANAYVDSLGGDAQHPDSIDVDALSEAIEDLEVLING
jgi:tetratricopeptide (TPR) repeat protein